MIMKKKLIPSQYWYEQQLTYKTSTLVAYPSALLLPLTLIICNWVSIIGTQEGNVRGYYLSVGRGNQERHLAVRGRYVWIVGTWYTGNHDGQLWSRNTMKKEFPVYTSSIWAWYAPGCWFTLGPPKATCHRECRI